MNRFEERLSHTLKEVKMKDEDRARLRERLSLAIATPTRASRPLVRKISKRTMPIALLIAMLLSGSVSYAAEGSLPGDTLYPIKIHVNENLKGALALSAQAKAEHEARLAEERLLEAEALRGEARLSTSTRDELKDAFIEHRSRAKEHLEDFRSEDATSASEVSAEFEQRFGRRGEHHDALIDLGVSLDDEGDDHGGDRGDEERNDEVRIDATASGTIRSGSDDRSREGDRREDSSRVDARSETHVELDDDHRGRGGDDEADDDDDRGGLVPSIVNPILAPTPAPQSSSGGSAKTYTLVDISSHNTAASCYTAISGSVYDLTSFIPGHPGGSVILSVCGKDGTALFSAQHGGAGKPQAMLVNLKIGVLAN